MFRSYSPASAARFVVPSGYSAPATAIVAVATTLQASNSRLLHVPGCAPLPDPNHDDESSLVR